MKIKLVCFCLWLLSLQGFSQQQYLEYPKLSELKEKFFSAYKTPDNKLLDVVKKQEGIYIVEHAYEYPYDSVTSYLFWSAKKKKYERLNYPVAGKDSPEQSFLYQGDDYQFDKNIFYGYTNWYDDVIRTLEGKKLMKDKLLYALARAYSSKAFKILGHGYSSHTSKEQDPSTLSQQQIESGIAYAHKAIKTFYEVYRINPLFETIVGNIYDKYSNEYLSFYYILEINNLPQYSKQFIVDGLYTPVFYDFGKNILNNCKDSSVLFVGGDGDTYPLLYVQQKEGLKKTVKIVNTSLLNSIFYSSYIFKTTNLSSSFPASVYKQDFMDYFYLDKTENTLPYDSLVKDILKNRENSFYWLNQNSQDYLILRGNSIAKDEFTIRYKDRDYFSKSNLVVLDMIANNYKHTDFYFSCGVSNEDCMPYSEYLSDLGMVKQLNAHSQHNNTTNFVEKNVRVELPATFDYFQSKFVFQTQTSQAKYFQNGTIRVVGTYRDCFENVVAALIHKADRESAKIMLDKAMKLFPFELYPPDYFTPGLVGRYYQTGQPEEAEMLMDKCYQCVINYFETNNEYSLKKEPSYLAINLAILDELSRISKDNGKTELGNRYYETMLNYYTKYYK